MQFITQDVQDLLSEDPTRAITGHSGRALLQNAAFKLLLQQDAAAISTVGDAFDLPQDLQRWLLSCPRGDGLLLARGNRFPIRIEATPEEAEVIEWRPEWRGGGPHARTGTRRRRAWQQRGALPRGLSERAIDRTAGTPDADDHDSAPVASANASHHLATPQEDP